MNICEEKPKPARSSCESRPQTLHRSSLLKSLASPLSVCSMSLKAPWFVTFARLGRDGGQRRPGTTSFSFSALKWDGSGRLLLVPSGEFDRSVNGRDLSFAAGRRNENHCAADQKRDGPSAIAGSLIFLCRPVPARQMPAHCRRARGTRLRTRQPEHSLFGDAALVLQEAEEHHCGVRTGHKP